MSRYSFPASNDTVALVEINGPVVISTLSGDTSPVDKFSRPIILPTGIGNGIVPTLIKTSTSLVVGATACNVVGEGAANMVIGAIIRIANKNE
ncbi:hypothetical protein [Sphingobacterium kitahiroshimense]|uniref:Uncharacterized protein n=1 Tax=Sphingobacterium kitahiroshimense TaxID=470446 RepID=A0ABV0BVT0_9SPHI